VGWSVLSSLITLVVAIVVYVLTINWVIRHWGAVWAVLLGLTVVPLSIFGTILIVRLVLSMLAAGLKSLTSIAIPPL